MKIGISSFFRIYLFVISIIFSTTIFAQDAAITVSGKVTFADNNEPIPGVSIIIKDKNSGVITDSNGNYTLSNVPKGATLVFTFIGMETSEVLVEGRTRIDVEMKEKAKELEDVVVVGYGTQLKRDLTGAITSVSEDDMSRDAGGNINTALQGRIPGMSITSSSGEPGAGANIQIRGASSLSGGSEPLYIVDGVPFESENIASLEGDATFSPLMSINPNDIQSIEVLRDAASAAIYGSRAANGVVIITTKGGNKFEDIKPSVKINHTSSLVSLPRKLDVMNGWQFRAAYIQARENNNLKAENPWITNPFHPFYNRTTDWQNEIFRTAYQADNNISINGSSKVFSYGISAGYKNLQPIAVFTDYSQVNFRSNFSYRLTNKIRGSTRVSYDNRDYTRILSSAGNYYSATRAALFTNPTFYPYDPVTGEVLDWLGAREQRNPLALAKKVPNTFKRNHFSINQSLTATLAKYYTISTRASISNRKTQQSSYRPKIFDSNKPPRDIGKFYTTDSRTLMNENTINYLRALRKHRISVLLGQSLQADLSETTYLNGEQYIDPVITPIQAAAKFTRITRDESNRYMFSLFGRLNYSYASRYIFNFTLRRDGSSRFGADKRFGYFPSASFAWRFSDEGFMEFAKDFLDDAKLRASYGVTGNQFTSNYGWQGVFTSLSKRYDGNVAILHSDLANYDLGWETTTQYNAGIDLTFKKKRVYFSADVYIKNSKDLLFNFPLSYYTGFSSTPMNFGSISNKGAEFLLETINIKNKTFNWETSFNISFNKNKITALPQDGDVIIGDFSLGRVGEPIGAFYAYKALGVYARDEDNIYIAPDGTEDKYRKGASTGEAFKGGDMMWYDVDKNGVIDETDRMVIGNPHPKFIGGMTNNFSYKNFTLNVFFNWSYGNKIMNELRRRRNQMSFTNNLGQDALNRWQKQGDITSFPMIRSGDAMENFRPSTFNLEDGSFLRLKELTLQYDMSYLVKKTFVESFNIYLSAANLLTWSKYSGFDPEVNSSINPFINGVDNGSLPNSRSVTLGISLIF